MNLLASAWSLLEPLPPNAQPRVFEGTGGIVVTPAANAEMGGGPLGNLVEGGSLSNGLVPDLPTVSESHQSINQNIAFSGLLSNEEQNGTIEQRGLVLFDPQDLTNPPRAIAYATIILRNVTVGQDANALNGDLAFEYRATAEGFIPEGGNFIRGELTVLEGTDDLRHIRGAGITVGKTYLIDPTEEFAPSNVKAYGYYWLKLRVLHPSQH